jgi:predicted ATP-dependent protease
MTTAELAPLTTLIGQERATQALHMDGDRASSTELYALLSRLANLPVRQELAVTGSVNQRGAMQAMGGVNEEIEGFYNVCAQPMPSPVHPLRQYCADAYQQHIHQAIWRHARLK